ncbi:protein of unknown function [Pseudomonas cuatrocienegasensis]|uniref:DUF4347 domain-containing protein n=1 Tax=Pseudomonas cuatrocienegasensis TaxID=543360 RepID=A0ABY1BM88_9PSED|nr:MULTISPECIES: DUF4347 domain-containing protein [Pseudomonas]OEC35163.1 hypothetical protein A7D25_09995 [Pseudomonas sp. 21C1]SER17205.1 protein of unknown function [Pseudomonas cuatrocienegasensis]
MAVAGKVQGATAHDSLSSVGPLALEPRYMFDAAGVATGADAAQDAQADAEAQHTADNASDSDVYSGDAAAAPAPGERKEIVVVDTSVAGWQDLIFGLAPGTETILLDGTKDGIAQLAQALNGRTGIDAIHILSHGDTGMVKLGTDTLASDTLALHSESLRAIGQSLSEQGDLLLYGCLIGDGGEGQSFVSALATLTGADIAVSNDLTGAESLGGDWDLEITTGDIEASVPLSSVAMNDFTGVLATTLTFEFDAATVNNGNIHDSSGGYAVVVSGGINDLTLFDHPSSPGKVIGVTGDEQSIGFGFSNSQVSFSLKEFYIYTQRSDAVTVRGYNSSGIRVFSFNAALNPFYAGGYGRVSTDNVVYSGQFVQDIAISSFKILNANAPTFGAGVANPLIFFDHVIFEDVVAAPINTAPSFSNLNGGSTFTEGGSSVVIDSNATAFDSELDAANNYTGSSLSITRNGGANAADVFGSSGQLGTLTQGQSFTWNGTTVGTVTANSGGSLLLSFNSSATTAVVNGVLQSITYSNNSNDPSTPVTLNYAFNDGTTNSTGTNQAVVAINAVNDAPTLNGTGGDPIFNEADFTENGSAVDLFSGVSISTVESGQTITGFSFTVTNADSSDRITLAGTAIPLVSGGGLTATNGLSYNVSMSGSVATVTITGGSMTTASAQSVIDGMTYNSLSDNPSNAARVVTLTGITDSGGTSNGGVATTALGLSVTVLVNPVNDIPIATTSGGTTAYSEGTAVVVDSAFTLADIDNSSMAGASIAITGGLQSASDVLSFTNQNNITGSYNAGTGVLTLSGTATVAQYQAAIRSITFNTTSDDPSTTNRTVSITVNDGTNNSTTATKTLSVTPVNDAPTIIATGGMPIFSENGSPVDLFSGVTIDTVESAQTILGFTFTVSNAEASDRITLDGTAIALAAGASGTTVGGNGLSYAVSVTGGVATVTISGGSMTTGAAQSVIDGMSYSSVSDNPGAGNRIVTLTSIRDSGGVANGGSDTGTVSSIASVAITQVNDAAVLANSGSSVNFSAGGVTGVVIDNSLTVSDVDNTTLASANVAITSGLATGDVLSFTPNGAFGNITGSYTAGTLTLTSAGGTATLAEWQAALRSVTFSSTEASPSITPRTISFTINDGTDNSNTVTSSVNIVFAPTISNLNGDSVTFTEGGGAVLIDAGSNATVSDNDNTDFDGGNLTVSITAGAEASEDILTLDQAGGVTLSGLTAGSTVSVGGTVIGTLANNIGAGNDLSISFNNEATLARVATLLHALQYNNNNADDPTAGNRTVRVTLTDAAGGFISNPADVTVTVVALNDAPTLSATGNAPTFTENGAAVDLFSGVTIGTVESGQTISGFSFTVTNTLAGDRITLDGTAIALTAGTSGTTAGANGLSYAIAVTGGVATVTLTGGSMTTGAAQSLIDGMTYASLSDDPGTGNRVVTLTGITDSGGTANGGVATTAVLIAATVAVTPVNDAPLVGGVFGDTSAVTAGAGAQNITGFDDATVTNPDSSDYAGGSLSITQASGTANGIWAVDGILASSGADTRIAANESIMVGGVNIGTVHASNDGQGGNTLEITLNANATSERVQTLLRSLTYSAPSGLGDRSFTLALNDGDGVANGGVASSSGAFTLSINPNPPVIGNLSGDSVSTGNNVAVSIDQGANVTVIDADSGNFNGGNLTINVTSAGGLSGNFLLNAGLATSAGDGTIAVGETLSVGGVAIGMVTADGQGGSNLVITFNSAATAEHVQTLVRALQFQSSQAGEHSFSLTVSDASGGGSATSTAATFAVTVQAIPVNTIPGAQNVIDGTPHALGGISVADSDSATVTTTVSVGAGLGTFSTTGGATITGAGSNSIQISGSLADVNATLANLLYTPTVNASGAQTITVVTTDGANTDTDTILVSVSDRPTVAGLGGDSITYSAGQTVVLDSGLNATVSDAEGDFNGGNLTVSLSGGAVVGQDVLTLVAAGTTVSLPGGLTAGSAVSVGGIVIGTLSTTIAAGNDLVISFNGNATAERVQELVRALAYRNDAATPGVGTRTIDITLTDGSGNTSGANTVSVVIAAPVVVPPPVTVSDPTPVIVTVPPLLGATGSSNLGDSGTPVSNSIASITASNAGLGNQIAGSIIKSTVTGQLGNTSVIGNSGTPISAGLAAAQIGLGSVGGSLGFSMGADLVANDGFIDSGAGGGFGGATGGFFGTGAGGGLGGEATSDFEAPRGASAPDRSATDERELPQGQPDSQEDSRPVEGAASEGEQGAVRDGEEATDERVFGFSHELELAANSFDRQVEALGKALETYYPPTT